MAGTSVDLMGLLSDDVTVPSIRIATIPLGTNKSSVVSTEPVVSGNILESCTFLRFFFAVFSECFVFSLSLISTVLSCSLPY